VSFESLDPVQERLRIVEGFLAQLPHPCPPTLAPATRVALARAKRAMVEELEGEEREYELQTWREHLDALSDYGADQAAYELQRFAQVYDGLRPAGHQEEDADA
jgi:hypothetical protein